MTMKHIKLLGLLATAAALSFTTTSCSNGDAGGDVEFPPPGEKAPVPTDSKQFKGSYLYIPNYPSTLTDSGTCTIMLYFGDNYVSTSENTRYGDFSTKGPSDGTTYTYSPISDTEANITVPNLPRPTKYDAEKDVFTSKNTPTNFNLKYSENAGTYSVTVDGKPYEGVNFYQI